MTAILPPHLLKNFAPRPPLPFFAPLDTPTHLPVHVTGVGAYLSRCTDHDCEPQPETILQRRTRVTLEKQRVAAEKISAALLLWDPQSSSKATEDPYTTLFVGRLNHTTTEPMLEKEFGKYGSVDKVVLVKDTEEKSRGYAFVQYKNEGDLKEAFKRSDGVKLDGSRIVVDVERGRTVKGWKPKRLGGGLGGTRGIFEFTLTNKTDGGPDKNQLYSGRDTGRRGRSRDQPREAPVDRRDVGRREEPRRNVDTSRMDSSRRYEPARDDQRRDDRRGDRRDERREEPRRDGLRRDEPRRDDRRMDDRRREEPRREETRREEPRRDERREEPRRDERRDDRRDVRRDDRHR